MINTLGEITKLGRGNIQFVLLFGNVFGSPVHAELLFEESIQGVMLPHALAGGLGKNQDRYP